MDMEFSAPVHIDGFLVVDQIDNAWSADSLPTDDIEVPSSAAVQLEDDDVAGGGIGGGVSTRNENGLSDRDVGRGPNSTGIGGRFGGVARGGAGGGYFPFGGDSGGGVGGVGAGGLAATGVGGWAVPAPSADDVAAGLPLFGNGARGGEDVWADLNLATF
jgi:hypothetical protein